MPNTSELKQATTYTFKYGSDSNSIDLDTLLLSQTHFATVLNEVKRQVSPDTNLSIRIRPLEKGSVPFDLILDISWLNAIFASGAIASVGQLIFMTVVHLMELRRASKGKKLVTVVLGKDKVTVIIDGVEREVDRVVYDLAATNRIIDTALLKTFQAIDKDEEVTKIEILDPDKKSLISIPREDFIDFLEPNEMFDEALQTETLNETLVINKVAFENGYKWQFYLKGRKLNATMEDTNFMDKVKAGSERFAAGDALKATLISEKVYDTNLEIFVEKDFRVITVHQHIPRGEQSKMDL